MTEQFIRAPWLISAWRVRMQRMLAVALVGAVFFAIPFLPRLLAQPDQYGLVTDRLAPDFILHNAAQQPVSVRDFRGHFVFLMFGYLHCKDVCHAEALVFQEINRLADSKPGVQFVMIGMDPEHDSASALASYFDHRGDNFTSLHATDVAAVQDLALQYGVPFSVSGPSIARTGVETRYTDIQHSGRFFLIDPRGVIRRSYASSQMDARLILQDLMTVAEQTGRQPL